MAFLFASSFFSLLLISSKKILFYIYTRYVFIYIVITRLKHVMETWRYGIYLLVFKSISHLFAVLTYDISI